MKVYHGRVADAIKLEKLSKSLNHTDGGNSRSLLNSPGMVSQRSLQENDM